MFDTWKEENFSIKVATVFVALAAIAGFILGFKFLDDYFKAFGSMLGVLPFNLKGILIAYLFVFYGIDILVVIGLLNMKRWAYRIAFWWGFFAIFSFLTTMESPMCMPYLLNALGGLILFFNRKHFPKG